MPGEAMPNLPQLIIIPSVIASLSGLVGVILGAIITSRRETEKRKLDFIEKQLKYFYSPLVGIRKEIRILSEYRLEVTGARREIDAEIIKNAETITDPMRKSEYYGAKRSGDIGKPVEYDNKQLKDKLIPAYKRMIDCFRDNYYLAEESTKSHFPTLIKYVDGWDRYYSETHGYELMNRLNVSEEELMPFYQDIEETLDRLRGKLKRAEA